ncbi:RNA-binding S4 domain-containing protein [Conexibacter sp. W3-3-2]|uniref:RNA-binding S4 domain-containing protein n=1 Tax=Conexibacter sp. W3-3-2 TaxID=2675227 RepID=UPI0012B94AB3|nr:RNA-binding S4 domain-containing protein [Conexibacter sp. W3-3-2]MTD43133.1 RNA-binding S4 domain-containing protein [Conexibacter sp. W3-3-2]
MREIPLRDGMIRLGQLLKLADLVDSGGEVRWFLDEAEITVNGEPESRRGRQLVPGDLVVVNGEELRLVAT